MTANEKQILSLLKQGVAQSAIAKQVGVPRSVVQRVSDKELGVDPASLKSLTTENIQAIQAESAAGTSNRSLADKFNVSAKTIARALMVNIVEVDGAYPITVISPIKEMTSDGKINPINEVMEGSTAVEEDGTRWYVGKFLENHGRYLCLAYTTEGNIKGKILQKDDLSVDDHTGEFTEENVPQLAELSVALTEGKDNTADGFTAFVLVDNERYALRGTIDARRRIGYFDPVLNRVLRLSITSVYFDVQMRDPEEIGERKTSKDLGASSIDVFLNKHQIMILPESVIIAINGKPETITTSHQAYEKIVEAIKNQDIETAYTLMKPREAIKKFGTGMVNVEGNKVFWDKHDITGSSVSKRILALMLKGDYANLERMGKFLDKMFQNPSAALVQSGRIYEFMAYSDVEIDEDGDIILYKSVRGNYMDKHSGTINNAPGTIVRMARSFVNDNNKDLCSYGLHVCSLAYLKQCFGRLGQRVVRCKLNPKDIVSITDDYKSSKIRCCEYLVLDDYTAEYNRQHKSIDIEGLYR